MIKELRAMELELTAPPILKKWTSVYWAVGLYQVALLLVLYFISISF